MTSKEISEEIIRYLNDQSRYGALMLTSAWGTGKSYYINNELIPYLVNQNHYNVILVSLHGLANQFEISRAIYFEYILQKSKFTKFFRKKTKAVLAGAKTIAKGIASFFNIDFKTSEKDLTNIYKSVDLSKTLLILEDFERSKMGPSEIMGFVNNLVEYDNTKVLIVANEKEITDLDDKNNFYERIKEKTVSDTFIFNCDKEKVISTILNESKLIEQYSQEVEVENISREIVNALNELNIKEINFRSIKSAIYLIKTLAEDFGDNINPEYLKTILISTIIFIHKRKSGNKLVWENKADSPAKLASYKYPMSFVVYCYIVNRHLNKDVFKENHDEYVELQEKEKLNNIINEKLSVLYQPYIQREQDLIDVIDYIFNELVNEKISFEYYYKIANYLIFLKFTIGYQKKIDSCLLKMVDNLRKADSNVVSKLHLTSGIELESEEAKRDFEIFSSNVRGLVKTKNTEPFNFSYRIDDLENFIENTNNKSSRFINYGCFAKMFDNDKLIELIKECTAKQLNDLRTLFLSVYSFSNLYDYFSFDIDSLQDLKNKLDSLNNYSKFDRIQKLQIRYFISNIDDILKRLKVDN